MPQRLVAQTHHLFFARQHRKRIAGRGIDHDDLDRVRADIDCGNFHFCGLPYGALVAAARVSAPAVSFTSAFAVSLPTGSPTGKGSRSTTFVTNWRSEVATRLTGREASMI